MSELNSSYWSERYQKNETGWDLGQVSPPLKEYFDQILNKDLKILIPGCGRGYEGIYLWDKGFRNVFFADFSQEAINSIKEKRPEIPSSQLICDDFFKIENTFDLIIEQTMFCAIDPSLRKEYVKKVRSLLQQDGKLIGLLFNRNFEGGPPFGGSKSEYENLFSTELKIEIMEDSYNSIAPRLGSELFIKMKKN